MDRICVGVPPGEVRTDPQRHTAAHRRYTHFITNAVNIIDKTNIDDNHHKKVFRNILILWCLIKNMVHVIFILALKSLHCLLHNVNAL